MLGGCGVFFFFRIYYEEIRVQIVFVSVNVFPVLIIFIVFSRNFYFI